MFKKVLSPNLLDYLSETQLDYAEFFVFNLIVMVSVAQLVEPRIVIPVVVGSSPIVHPSCFGNYFGNAMFVFIDICC